MSLPLLVGIQQFHNSNLEFIAQDKSRAIAEGRALMEYIERQAYMVVVVEIDQFTIFNDEKVVEVFKITRTCKCITIQRFFNYQKATSFWKCTDCGIQYGKEEPINADTRAEQDAQMADREEGAEDETGSGEALHIIQAQVATG